MRSFSIQSEDPFVDYLKRIRTHLAPGGRLVIAIENRIGLKYWAGATEDHTGIYFEGAGGISDDQLCTDIFKAGSRSR